MLCSDCSRTIRPVVALDIDGTLGKYHQHFRAFAEGYLGMHSLAEDYAGQTAYRDWFTRTYGVDVRTFRDIKLAYRQGGMKRTMPVYPHAMELAQKLRRRAELWVTTTRPYLRLDNIDPDTRHWLERHNVRYDGLLYDEDKYERLAERVDPSRVVAVLDDIPQMVKRADQLFDGAGLLILRQSNHLAGQVYGLESVTSLHHAEDVIQDRIYRWEQRHA